MGARRNFCRGGGEGMPKKGPPHGEKEQKGPHIVKSPSHVENRLPHKEKNVAKRPTYKDKVAQQRILYI